MRSQRRTNESVRALAAGQHGVVTRLQLLGAGLSAAQIDARVRSGSLTVIHRGVYLASPLLSPEAVELAAALSCGPNAWISHVSAAYRNRLVELDAPPKPVHVTVRGRDPGNRGGTVVHRCRRIGPDEVTIVDRIPITTPARTILDLAADLDPERLEQLVAKSLRAKRTSRPALLELTSRHPRHRGAGRLRRLLGRDRPVAFTRSAAERRLLALVRSAGLPEPEVNVRIAGAERDFVWRRERVVVEVDGYEFHSDRQSFRNDRNRDAALIALGFRVLRFTWEDLATQPAVVVARIAATLAVAPGT